MVADEGGAAIVEEDTRLRRLWAAVLLDALRSAARSRFRRWEKGANVAAREWLDQTEAEGVGTLAWICLLLGYDVDEVRAHGKLRKSVPQRRSALRPAA